MPQECQGKHSAARCLNINTYRHRFITKYVITSDNNTGYEPICYENHPAQLEDNVTGSNSDSRSARSRTLTSCFVV